MGEESNEVRVNPSRHWVIDKRIPVAAIAAFAMAIGTQTYYACEWANKMDYRVASLETSEQSNKISREKVTTLETKMDNISATLADIKNSELRDIKETLAHMIWDKPNHQQSR